MSKHWNKLISQTTVLHICRTAIHLSIASVLRPVLQLLGIRLGGFRPPIMNYTFVFDIVYFLLRITKDSLHITN